MVKLNIDKEEFNPQRIFCIGQNYSEHIKEMNSDIPSKPVIFAKPNTCIVLPGEDIYFPKHGKLLHHEIEVVVLIGREGKDVSREQADSYIAGLTLGLDLTLRDIQMKLKDKGHPWEVSKAFDQSAPLGDFTPLSEIGDVKSIEFYCEVNGKLRQQGSTKNMIFSISDLICEISTIWRLYPGDLIYTGTPAGVGPLNIGDNITAASDILGKFSWNLLKTP